MSEDVQNGYMSRMRAERERDPSKRTVKLPPDYRFDPQGDESSDDSDFHLDDFEEESDDTIDSNKTDGADNNVLTSDDSSCDDCSGVTKRKPSKSVYGLIKEAEEQKKIPMTEYSDPICGACLGDRSDEQNEIVECDNCGICVHEGCYGISDTDSNSSTVSSCQTAPWFCDPCVAGIQSPSCEICPNKNGIFKETDVGKWIHLICALYVRGIAFEEVDRLTSVTLFEMTYSQFGAKSCTLCDDVKFCRTGVCISCDAGLCRTYFHVTCAQMEGLLSEAHSEEADHADPYYAHCKLHTDRAVMKRRRMNWLIMQSQTKARLQKCLQKDTSESADSWRRIQRKINRSREKYQAKKASKPLPWVPTQKMPRPISTSSEAIRKFHNKSSLMGIDTTALEVEGAEIASIIDSKRKWNVPPAFSVEFISYYLSRESRKAALKEEIEKHLAGNLVLKEEEQNLRSRYDQLSSDHHNITEDHVKLQNDKQLLDDIMHYCTPRKSSQDFHQINTRFTITKPHALPTRESTKKSQSSPGLTAKCRIKSSYLLSAITPEDGMSLFHECQHCGGSNDQHLLVDCDTCKQYYHLGCLTPPLRRMPKKSRLMGWSCSACDKASSNSEMENIDVSAPRQLRKVVKGPAKYTELNKFSKIMKKSWNVSSIRMRKHEKRKRFKRKHKEGKARKRTMVEDGFPRVTDISDLPVCNDQYSTDGVQKQPTIKLRISRSRLHPDADNELSFASSLVSSSFTSYNPIVWNNSSRKKSIKRLRFLNGKSKSGASMLKSRTTQSNDDYPIHTNFQSINLAATSNSNMYTSITCTAPTDSSVLYNSSPLPHSNQGDNWEGRRQRKNSSISPIKSVETSVDVLTSSSCSDVNEGRRQRRSYSVSPIKSVETSSVLTISPCSDVNEGRRQRRNSSVSPIKSVETSIDVLISSPYLAVNEGKEETICLTCQHVGNKKTLVRCDKCSQYYHFLCLDPPKKTTPKPAGYSWHCSDCYILV